jgi:hypothetical protein
MSLNRGHATPPGWGSGFSLENLTVVVFDGKMRAVAIELFDPARAQG